MIMISFYSGGTKMLSNNQLNEIIQKFSENYNNEELFYVEEGHQMPSRDEIIRNVKVF